MKTYKYLLILATMAILALGFPSCKKNTSSSDEAPHVHLSIANKVGTADLSYGVENTLSNSRKYTFSRVQYYISNIRLIQEDNTDYPIDGLVELISDDGGLIDIDDIPEGHYHGVKFTVGIADSAVNHSDPATYSSDSPLAPQNPSMHWSWNTGYKFLVLEGTVDATADTAGTPNYNWIMHLGGDVNAVDVTLTDHFDAGTDLHPVIGVACNLTNMIDNNMDLGGADSTTHTMDHNDLAMRLKANISGAFSVQ